MNTDRCANTDKHRFDEWVTRLNARVEEIVGIGLDDLPDMPTRDWFDDGMTVCDACSNVIRKARI